MTAPEFKVGDVVRHDFDGGYIVTTVTYVTPSEALFAKETLYDLALPDGVRDDELLVWGYQLKPEPSPREALREASAPTIDTANPIGTSGHRWPCPLFYVGATSRNRCSCDIGERLAAERGGR